MCVVSAIGDNWRDRLPETYPWINPNPQPGQPDCEMDDKVNLIKRVAELVGVDIKDIFK